MTKRETEKEIERIKIAEKVYLLLNSIFVRLYNSFLKETWQSLLSFIAYNSIVVEVEGKKIINSVCVTSS